MTEPKIVVVTPIKNEEWILDRFLSVTSQLADHIIVADQKSSDQSVEICRKYPKVTLVENKAGDFNEADRQILLLQTAREKCPGPRIILALDADEMLAANAAAQTGWQTMLQAEPGTVLCFEKPDLYSSTNRCIRFDTPWPLGYVDDGAVHQPRKIHSIRIPMPENATRLNVHDVKIIHYGLLRREAQASKMRLYCVLENILATSSLTSRRVMYAADKNYTNAGRTEAVEKEWFAGWENAGIDMHSIPTSKYYWQDFEVLRHFAKHGEKQFWRDDIWKFDWDSCRTYAISHRMEGIPTEKITGPPLSLSASLPLFDKIIGIARKAKAGVYGQVRPRWM